MKVASFSISDNLKEGGNYQNIPYHNKTNSNVKLKPYRAATSGVVVSSSSSCWFFVIFVRSFNDNKNYAIRLPTENHLPTIFFTDG